MATQQALKVLNQHVEDRFSLYHGDSTEVIRGLPSNSIGLTVTSPPFCNLYCYSPSLRDMGNTRDDPHFFTHFGYLIPELLRVTIPGRLCVIHCKDLPLFMGSDGEAGLRDFPGEIVRAFVGKSRLDLMTQIDSLETIATQLTHKPSVAIVKAQILELQRQYLEESIGRWVFHSRVTIWKCPKTEMERTNNHGLLHSQLCKDSSVSRQGMADYLLVFRKWSPGMNGLDSEQPVNQGDAGKYRFDGLDYIGTNPPLTNPKIDPRGYSIETWQRYASPVWNDIRQTDVLNTKATKEGDEPHICPLQTTVISRCLELWSNPGDVILDPFNGIASTGHEALRMGRRYVGMELKENYFNTSIKNLSRASLYNQTPLF